MTEPMPMPVIHCPVDDCDFVVRMRLAEVKRSPFILDSNPAGAMIEAMMRNSEAEGERVERVLNEHGARDHEPAEFEAACQAVMAGLR